jgi:hypothetical protein
MQAEVSYTFGSTKGLLFDCSVDRESSQHDQHRQDVIERRRGTKVSWSIRLLYNLQCEVLLAFDALELNFSLLSDSFLDTVLPGEELHNANLRCQGDSEA